MSVQFPTFQRAPAPDYSGIGNIFENMLSGYKISRTPSAIQRQEELEKYNNLIKAVQAEFARPKAGAELSKLQSDARYAGPLAEALLGQRQAAAQMYGVKAKTSADKLQLLSDLLSGNLNKPPQQENLTLPQNLYEGRGMPSPSLIENRSESPSNNNQNQISPINNEHELNGGNEYLRAMAAQSLLGMGKPQIIDVDGTKYVAGVTGVVPIAQGLNPEQKSFKSGLGKYKASLYGDVVDSVKSYSNRALALDNLINLAQNNSEFMNVTGKINKPITNWFGTPEQQDLLGQLQSSSGEITLQVADALKGAWDGKDQDLVDSIKASPNDFPNVFIGKLKAQKLIDTVLQKRSELLAEYLERGDGPLKALKLATKQTPINKYRAIINQMIGKKSIDIQTHKATGKKYQYVNGQWEEL